MTALELLQNATKAVCESYRGGRRDAEYVAIVVIRESLASLTDPVFAEEVREVVEAKMREKLAETGTATKIAIRKIMEDG